mmetsp:Transcript_45460/g.97183  ORF Transcript_45460/g.97183 Transcript_45460/m.97183 type:complete len:166 (-) Transcript_45460:17-514(-)
MNWEKGTYYEVCGLTSEAGQKMNGMAVFLRGWDEAKGRYDCSPADNLNETKALKADNLQLIPEKYFGSVEEATAFQMDLMEAYQKDDCQTMLLGLQAKYQDRTLYIRALRPLLIEFQKAPMAKHGFRPDYVGLGQMQKALAVWDAIDGGVFARNRETEKAIGILR